MHISIPIANTMEFIEATTVSPLITKCKVKVCYVGQDPNRNGTVITKEVATELGRNLPGSPVVGCFNKETKDFGGHDKDIVISGGKFEIVEKTRPYGFVPTDAKVWFEKFTDDGVEHEYLVTECYLWTSAYPECQVTTEHGSNQSMELDKDKQSGFWTNDKNSNKRIFIYSEALIEKLCILGQDIEPCFEGAQITAFSLDTSSQEFQEFKSTMYSMITELQNTLNKGGSQPMEENKNTQTEFEKQKEEEKNKNTPPQEENKPGTQEEDKKKKPNEENACGNKKKDYNLDEIPEYQDLMSKYTTLQSQFSTLQQEKTNLDNEVVGLRQFKLTAERQSKQAMIDSFYMLSDKDKEDVVSHMDTYSIDDIEAKLSIICVRNKVDFNLNNNNNQPKQEQQNPQGLFNLNTAVENSAPAWVQAIRETAKNQ